jgi:hypothetical protein
MVYDEARHQLLLFGGTGTEGTGPSVRVHAIIAFDRTRNRTVLFGGFNATTNAELRDIWEWDGTAWQQSTSSASTGTVSLGVAYDEKTAALYLSSLTGTAFSAYRWNGTAVTAATAAATPAFRSRINSSR